MPWHGRPWSHPRCARWSHLRHLLPPLSCALAQRHCSGTATAAAQPLLRDGHASALVCGRRVCGGRGMLAWRMGAGNADGHGAHDLVFSRSCSPRFQPRDQRSDAGPMEKRERERESPCVALPARVVCTRGGAEYRIYMRERVSIAWTLAARFPRGVPVACVAIFLRYMTVERCARREP